MSGIIEDEIIGSQTDDESTQDNDIDASMDEVFSMFDIKEEQEEQSVNDKPPAKEEVKVEQRIEKVKHNKEETEVDISTTEKLHDHLQRSLALDKERERKTELEKNLDRAAKIAGYKDHTEYVANFDKMEQQQQEQDKNAYNELRQDLRQQAEDAGLDPDKVEAYLNDHPLMKEAQQAIQERDSSRLEQETQTRKQTIHNQWQELYKAYPEIVEDSNKFTPEGGKADFYTPEMESMVNAGYKPLDAYRLAHMDKIQTKTVKASQQRLIKEQQLGLRSQVETNAAPDNEPAVPTALANAFEAFGMTASEAKKYMK